MNIKNNSFNNPEICGSDVANVYSFHLIGI